MEQYKFMEYPVQCPIKYCESSIHGIWMIDNGDYYEYVICCDNQHYIDNMDQDEIEPYIH